MDKLRIEKFPHEILEHIAGLISTKIGSEITRFFEAADYPEFIHNGSTKKWFVLDCLKDLNNRTDGAYHVVKIIKKLVDPRQYISNPESHIYMKDSLNNALVLHGLAIDNENQIILLKKPIPSKPISRDVRKEENELFNKIRLHNKIIQVSEKLYIDGHYAQAIFEAFKAVNNAIKEKSSISDKDGKSLMANAFSGDCPPIVLNSLRTQSEKDEQEGFKLIFMGVMTGIRNPSAHEYKKIVDPYITLHYLVLASLLMIKVDESISTSR